MSNIGIDIAIFLIRYANRYIIEMKSFYSTFSFCIFYAFFTFRPPKPARFFRFSLSRDVKEISH